VGPTLLILAGCADLLPGTPPLKDADDHAQILRRIDGTRAGDIPEADAVLTLARAHDLTLRSEKAANSALKSHSVSRSTTEASVRRAAHSRRIGATSAGSNLEMSWDEFE
jgi:hypothetical protein